MSKKAVVLLSGGIDSATCLYLAKKKGFNTHCLIFDYGQRHRREIQSAKGIARFTKSKYLILKINFPWKSSSLLDKNLKVPKRGNGIPSTYVPARNIIFLSYALSYAESINAKSIFIGANARDFSGYPDCRPQFYKAFKKVAQTGIKNNNIKISIPLLYKTKAEIIQLGKHLKVPFKLSWSCYRGGKKPCGECDSCRFRVRGFRKAGIVDPLAPTRCK